MTAVYGNVLVNKGRFEEALETFQTILRKHPRTVGALIGRATLYSALSRVDEVVNY